MAVGILGNAQAFGPCQLAVEIEGGQIAVGKDGKHTARPDFVTDNLLDAVRLLLAQTSK